MNYELFNKITTNDIQKDIIKGTDIKTCIVIYETNKDKIGICYNKTNRKYYAFIVGIYDIVEFASKKMLFKAITEMEINTMQFVNAEGRSSNIIDLENIIRVSEEIR